MKTVLVIDDEEKVCWAFSEFLKDEGYRALIANNAEEGLKKIASEEPDIVILDLWLPAMDGLEALKQIRMLPAPPYVVMISAHDTMESVVKAIQLGAYDYITKPIDLDKVGEVLGRISNSIDLSKSLDSMQPIERLGQIVGKDEQMQQVYKMIGSLSTNNMTVLIQGESGTGKELVARAIHDNSPRNSRPFVVVNCAAIPENLLESELFGHEKGSFTNAISSKPGKFELADGGTLFLDEVSCLSTMLQAKLLRAIQHREFERIGSVKSTKVDVRLIAATNMKLDTAVENGIFREDLYYRLKVVSISLPPLRARKDDILLLVKHFLQVANAELNKQIKGLDNRALEFLMNYHWPGNVRELENAIKSAALLSRADVILPEHFPKEITAFRADQSRDATNFEEKLESILREKIQRLGREPGLYEDIIAAVDKALLKIVLEKVNFNQVEAAKLLDISRTTLRKKLKELL